jgi:hypothetical protein
MERAKLLDDSEATVPAESASLPEILQHPTGEETGRLRPETITGNNPFKRVLWANTEGTSMNQLMLRMRSPLQIWIPILLSTQY